MDEGEAPAAQVARRAANDERAEAAGTADSLRLLCECAAADCGRQLELPREAYEKLRAHPMRFLVAGGHEDPSIERVVELRPGFSIVEKRSLGGGEVAKETDARRRPGTPRQPEWACLSLDPSRRELSGRIVRVSQAGVVRLAIDDGGVIDAPLPASFDCVAVGSPALIYFDEAGGLLGWYLPDEQRGVDLRNGGQG